MPAPSSAATLFAIDECPDLMADACVGEDQGTLVFASVWGRDTAIQQLIARLTLGHDQDGLDQFHLLTQQESSIPFFVGSVDRLEKRLTRVYRRTLFGSLINLWLFDRRCTRPDKSNASALALLPRAAIAPDARLWRLVRDTCPLPLLDHWQVPVLAHLRAHGMLHRLPLAIGPLDGHRLAMDVPALTQALGGLIRSGTLDVHETNSPLPRPLAAVA
ncbi:hypothetical protein B6S59_17365 [Pseudomonas sp. A46]|nr:hypothetical protein [Pseudomonas sp. A46]OWJ93200.1 hypothetical protein B6S59_17365 [Pseudomonas sp. A46]